MEKVIDISKTRAALIGGVRARLGDRLARLYQINTPPYAERGASDVHLVAVVHYYLGSRLEEFAPIADLLYELEHDTNYEVGLDVDLLSEAEFQENVAEAAQRVRREGTEV